MEPANEIYINKKSKEKVDFVATRSDENQNTIAVYKKLDNLEEELTMPVDQFLKEFQQSE